MNGFILKGKWSLTILEQSFSPKLDWGSYIVSIAKTFSNEIEILSSCMKFLSPEVVFLFLQIYHNTLHGTLFPWLLWCFQVLAWKILDKLQKRVCSAVCLSLTAFLEPLSWRRNIGSLSLFCRYNIGRSLSKLPELVSLLILVAGPLVIWVGCIILFVSIRRCFKDTYVDNFFPRGDSFSNYLHVEYFLLTNDLSGLKSRINGYLLSLCFFNIPFL